MADTVSKQSGERVVKHYVAIASASAKLARRLKIDLNDACSIATLAMLEKDCDYDPAKGAYSTFIGKVVNSALIDEARRRSVRQVVELDVDVAGDDSMWAAIDVRDALAGADPEDASLLRAWMREGCVRRTPAIESALQRVRTMMGGNS